MPFSLAAKMLPDTKQATHFPKCTVQNCQERTAGEQEPRPITADRHLCSLRKPRATGGEIQSAGLSGCAFQSPAEEDARSRKNNDVSEDGRGLAGLQMLLQPLREGAVHVGQHSTGTDPGCPGLSASESLLSKCSCLGHCVL